MKMKWCHGTNKKLALGIVLSLLSSASLAAEKQCKAHFIQLMVTSSPGKAHGTKKNFDQSDFNTLITPYKRDGKVLYRLSTGPYASKQAATDKHQKMKSLLHDNPMAQNSIIAYHTVPCSEASPAPAPEITVKAKPALQDTAAPKQEQRSNRTQLRFSQFKAPEAYTGENHPLVMGEFGNHFRTRLRAAIRDQKPTFAGHYIVTGWGCGSSGCNTGAVINAKTGIATPLPVSIASVFPLKPEFEKEDGQEHIFRLDSRLMIFAGNLGSDHSDGHDTVEFYEFDDGEFTFLESRPYGRASSN